MITSVQINGIYHYNNRPYRVLSVGLGVGSFCRNLLFVTYIPLYPNECDTFTREIGEFKTKFQEGWPK